MRLFSILRQTLRVHRNSINPIVRHSIGSIYAARECMVVCKKLCRSAEYRSFVSLKLFNSQSLHQTTIVTWMDRYPGIFSVCRDYFGDKQDLRILSFGCSTGEEVLTLRRYFPAAFITGAEINRRNLSLCGKHKVDGRIAFVHSDPEAIRQRGPFDAIFCMAVLQRTPHLIKDQGIKSLTGIYPFEKFDRQVSLLDRWLKRDGLLVIHHAQYLFRDASVAVKYEPLESAGQKLDLSPKFDRNSERLENLPRSSSIFIKRTN